MAEAALSKADKLGIGAWAGYLPALIGGMGIYAMYAMKKMGLLVPKEKPMTDKQKAAITFAHIILVLGDAIEKLTERCERAEADAKTLQESNASLAREDSKARQERSQLERDKMSLERDLADARRENERLSKLHQDCLSQHKAVPKAVRSKRPVKHD